MTLFERLEVAAAGYLAEHGVPATEAWVSPADAVTLPEDAASDHDDGSRILGLRIHLDPRLAAGTVRLERV